MLMKPVTSNTLLTGPKKSVSVKSAPATEEIGGSISEEQLGQLADSITGSLERKFGVIDRQMSQVNAEQSEVRKVVAHLIHEVHGSLALLNAAGQSKVV
jgi:hypothetical protein